MDLFDFIQDRPETIIDQEGTVDYYGNVMSFEEANFYFECLLNPIEWKNDEALIYGKLIVTKRKIAWYGDEPFEYTYSQIKKRALPWTDELLKLKELVEQKTGETFNSCLLTVRVTNADTIA